MYKSGFYLYIYFFELFVLLVVGLQDKLQNLAGGHADVLESLTPKVRKRVEVLRELQVWSHYLISIVVVERVI